MAKAKQAEKRVYVSGPMTGLPQFNFPAFDDATAYLVAAGCEVFSPADNDRKRLAEVGIEDITSVHGFAEGNVEWYNSAIDIDTESLFRDDFNYIVNEATHIVMLPGWELSTGARYERCLAEALGLEIVGAYVVDGPTEEDTGGVTPFEFVVEHDPKALTAFLRGFQQGTWQDGYNAAKAEEPEVTTLSPEAYTEVVGGTLTTHELCELLRAKIGHVPALNQAIDHITSRLGDA